MVEVGLSESDDDEGLFGEEGGEEIKCEKPQKLQVQICPSDVEDIKRVCEQNKLPLIKEYEFLKDGNTPSL